MTKTDGPASAAYLSWTDARRGMFPRQAESRIAGESWIAYPAIRGASVHGRLTQLPAGHVIPVTLAPADLMLLGVRGEAAITVGAQSWTLNPLDLMILPAGTRWRAEAPGLEPVLFHETHGCGSDSFDDAPAPAGGDVTHHDWRIYRSDFKWSLPWSDRWGFRRGSGPYFGAAGLRGHTVRQPPGQATPWHYAPRDLLFMPVLGEVEFRCGGRAYPLAPYDQLIIPAGMPYQYTNTGLTEVVFLSTGGALPPGGKGRYFAADPGWPIRADAPVMDTTVDPYGNATTGGH